MYVLPQATFSTVAPAMNQMMRVRRLIIAWLLAVLALVAITTTTTTAAALTFAYDAVTIARGGAGVVGGTYAVPSLAPGASERSVVPLSAERGASTTPFSRSVATEAARTSRVGRWMGADEHVAMVHTGQVQVGRGGTTYVASPANAGSYMSQAAPGSHYVEFDVPSSSLRPAGQPGWAQIPTAENTMWGKLAPQRGWDVPESPVPACNIVHVATKPSC